MSEAYPYWDRVIYKAVINHDMTTFTDAILNGVSNHHQFCRGAPTFGTLPLITHVIRNNFSAALKVLLQGPYIDTRSSVIEVCAKRNFEMINIFTRSACARHRDSSEVLFALLKTGLVETAIEFVNMDGFDVNDQSFQIPGKYVKCDYDRPGQSPLHVAALMRTPEVVEELLQKGAKVELVDGKGYNPLYCACLVGCYECCKVLIQHGASAAYAAEASYLKNPRSALFATCHMSSTSTENDDIAELLRSAGVIYGQEKWITEKERKKYVSETTLKVIVDNFQVVPRLDILCCHKIRLVLKTLSCGSSIRTRVEALPLLNSIIEFYFFLKFAEE